MKNTDTHDEKNGLPAALLAECRDMLKDVDTSAVCDALYRAASAKRTAPFCGAYGVPLGFFFDGFYPESAFFAPVRVLAAQKKCDARRLFLAFFIEFLPMTLSLYKKARVPDAYFRAYVQKLCEDAENFRVCNSFYGTSDYIWFTGFAAADLFALGTLEFRLAPYRYRPYTVNGVSIKRGMPVIQVHVPDGADIAEASRHDAYRKAASLFGTDVFVADSWLLYPAHQTMLAANSRIRAFASEYTLVETNETDDYEGLCRIFGKRERYIYEELPQKTALQRAYAMRVKEGLPIGSGVGVMRFYD